MIIFEKKPRPQSVPNESDENRFEQIRKAAKDRQRKSDTDGARRRERQTAENNRLV